MKRVLSLLLILALVLFATGFTVLNSGFVPLNLYFYQLEAPISLLVFVCVALGAVLGLVASSGSLLRRRGEARRLKKTISRMETEMVGLRKEAERPELGEPNSLQKTG